MRFFLNNSVFSQDTRALTSHGVLHSRRVFTQHSSACLPYTQHSTAQCAELNTRAQHQGSKHNYYFIMWKKLYYKKQAVQQTESRSALGTSVAVAVTSFMYPCTMWMLYIKRMHAIGAQTPLVPYNLHEIMEYYTCCSKLHAVNNNSIEEMKAQRTELHCAASAIFW